MNRVNSGLRLDFRPQQTDFSCNHLMKLSSFAAIVCCIEYCGYLSLEMLLDASTGNNYVIISHPGLVYNVYCNRLFAWIYALVKTGMIMVEQVRTTDQFTVVQKLDCLRVLSYENVQLLAIDFFLRGENGRNMRNEDECTLSLSSGGDVCLARALFFLAGEE